MEKLLLHIKIKGGKHAGNVTGQRTKIFSLAVDGYENTFCKAHANNKKLNRIQDVLSSSTNNRIIIKNHSTFSGRVSSLSATVPADEQSQAKVLIFNF